MAVNGATFSEAQQVALNVQQLLDILYGRLSALSGTGNLSAAALQASLADINATCSAINNTATQPLTATQLANLVNDFTAFGSQVADAFFQLGWGAIPISSGSYNSGSGL